MPPDLLTFGCRLNISESETMRHQALQAGLGDALIVNTCAVTDEATRQARQAIRRAGREQPGRPIIVTGCAAQIEPARFAAMPEVARVIGNAEKLMPETWAELACSNSLKAGAAGVLASERVAVGDIMQAQGLNIAPVSRFTDHTRGFVQVQNGCDHRCTFCVIPFGRGRSRSALPDTVIRQVLQLIENGAAEVVLTGVDLTSYGPDLATPATLGALVRQILRDVPELPRLRLSSIDAVEVDDTLMGLIADEPRLMPHLHLSLQSGDDMILKRMKRRHSRDEAIRFCETVRQLRPDMVLGADLIAGFPTEDEAMFGRSADLIAACGLAQVHVFPYSARPDTPAARMPQLPLSLVRERAARLREVAASAWGAHLDKASGRIHNVLTERGNTGRTEGFTPVAFSHDVEPGQVMRLAMAGHDGKRLIAA